MSWKCKKILIVLYFLCAKYFLFLSFGFGVKYDLDMFLTQWKTESISLCTWICFVCVYLLCFFPVCECVKELSGFRKQCKHMFSAALQLVVTGPALFSPCSWQAGHREGRGVTDSYTYSHREGLLTATLLLQKTATTRAHSDSYMNHPQWPFTMQACLIECLKDAHSVILWSI